MDDKTSIRIAGVAVTICIVIAIIIVIYSASSNTLLFAPYIASPPNNGQHVVQLGGPAPPKT